MATTERIQISVELRADDREDATDSLAKAMHKLQIEARTQNRIPLFDTLEISVEREEFGEITFAGRNRNMNTRRTIIASVEATRIPTTTTKE